MFVFELLQDTHKTVINKRARAFVFIWDSLGLNLHYFNLGDSPKSKDSTLFCCFILEIAKKSNKAKIVFKNQNYNSLEFFYFFFAKPFRPIIF